MSEPTRFTGFRIASLLVLAALVGCEPEPDPAAPTADPRFANGRAQGREQNEFPSRYRLDPSLTISGDFRPGELLTVQGAVLARSPSTNTSVAVEILDADQVVTTASLRMRQALGTIASGVRLNPVSGTIRFPEPGYYRVMIRTGSSPLDLASELRSGINYLDRGTTTLWVTITRNGGKASREWDSTVASSQPGFYLKYGSYGPFVSVPASRPSINTTYSGTVRYYNLDVVPAVLVPVPNALVEVFCSGVSIPDRRTDANGFFSVTFNSSQCRNDPKLIAYTSDPSANVLGRLGSAVSNSIILAGSPIDYRLANDYAGRVFDRLQQYVPIGKQRFARTRSAVSVWANNIDTLAYIAVGGPQYGIFYNSGQDRVFTNQTRIFFEEGDFVTLHEYGHAFHHKAIEPPSSYFCSDTGHFFHVEYTQSCAIVEGFADFFSAWVEGGRLFFMDNTIEDNPYRTYGDGARIEATVAAFLNDMVDSPSDPNGPNNETGSDDETITWPGGYVSDLIAKCTTTFAGATFTAIDGIDQFIYCGEHSISGPRAANTLYPNTFRALTTFSETATEPSGWSASIVRALWKYDLYNQGSLP